MKALRRLMGYNPLTKAHQQLMQEWERARENYERAESFLLPLLDRKPSTTKEKYIKDFEEAQKQYKAKLEEVAKVAKNIAEEIKKRGPVLEDHQAFVQALDILKQGVSNKDAKQALDAMLPNAGPSFSFKSTNWDVLQNGQVTKEKLEIYQNSIELREKRSLARELGDYGGGSEYRFPGILNTQVAITFYVDKMDGYHNEINGYHINVNTLAEVLQKNRNLLFHLPAGSFTQTISMDKDGFIIIFPKDGQGLSGFKSNILPGTIKEIDKYNQGVAEKLGRKIPSTVKVASAAGTHTLGSLTPPRAVGSGSQAQSATPNI